MADPDLEEFCEREFPRLVGLLRLYCGDESLAQDLAQEALTRAVAHWPRISRFESPGGWTYRVAVNLANSRFRRRKVARRVETWLQVEANAAFEAPDFATPLAVRAAVLTLPDRQREALILQHFVGLEAERIGELMGCSPQAVRNLTHRARERLRPVLASLEEEADRVPRA